MIFAWLKRRRAAAEIVRTCGFVDVEHFDGGVRSVPLSARDARVVEWRTTDPHWCMSIRGVNAPARLLHPSANVIQDDMARAALARLLQFFVHSQPPDEIEVVDGWLRVTWARFSMVSHLVSPRWGEFESLVLALANAVRVVGGTATLCPSCGAALSDRGGVASCDACNGKLITGDLARERVFDPRNIAPGALKDASVGRGLVARCPSCAHPMAPVLVDDVVVDVCKGCGALWCDAGEHARLMGGMT